jgi:hypothetical protein
MSFSEIFFRSRAVNPNIFCLPILDAGNKINGLVSVAQKNISQFNALSFVEAETCRRCSQVRMYREEETKINNYSKFTENF